MSQSQAKNPLHGITLEQVVTQLANHYGWAALGAKIAINCFKSDPSVKSSLKFLPKQPGRARRLRRSISRHFQIRVSSTLMRQVPQICGHRGPLKRIE